jgi:hypothetical protein
MLKLKRCAGFATSFIACWATLAASLPADRLSVVAARAAESTKKTEDPKKDEKDKDPKPGEKPPKPAKEKKPEKPVTRKRAAEHRQIRKVFEAALRENQIPFKGPDAKGSYEVLGFSGATSSITLKTLHVLCGTDAEKIRMLVKRTGLLSWSASKPLIYYMPTDDSVLYAEGEKLSASVKKYLAVVDPDSKCPIKVRWITRKDFERWGVKEKDVKALAKKHTDALLKGKKPVIKHLGKIKVLKVSLKGALRGAAILSPNFKEYVSKEIGWPVIVMAPKLDVVYAISAKEKKNVARVWRVVRAKAWKSGTLSLLSSGFLVVSDKGFKGYLLPDR